jgi:sec-independent protein translocase protein TatB
MFDVGFSEIVVIMLVALVVIGPERLPKVARTLGHLWGRAQRVVNSVKQDINTSVELEELRKLQSEVKSETDALQSAMQQTSNDIEKDVRQVEHELAQSVHDVKLIDATAHGNLFR